LERRKWNFDGYEFKWNETEKQNSETGPPGFGRIRSQGSVIYNVKTF
jgi:hypothetical protein